MPFQLVFDCGLMLSTEVYRETSELKIFNRKLKRVAMPDKTLLMYLASLLFLDFRASNALYLGVVCGFLKTPLSWAVISFLVYKLLVSSRWRICVV